MVKKNRNPIALRLGQNLMLGRKALQLTQEQVAAALSVEPETISRFERGVTLPSIVTLERLAAILRTTMSNLLEEGEPRQFTEMERISALLMPLPNSERIFVLETLERLCIYLLKR